MNDLLMLLIILLLLLILISSLGGSITIGPRYAEPYANYNNKKKPLVAGKRNNKKSSKEKFSEPLKDPAAQDCIQTTIVGACDGPCGGGMGNRKITYNTIKPTLGNGKECKTPTVEPCTNVKPCPRVDSVVSSDSSTRSIESATRAVESATRGVESALIKERFDFEAMDPSYGLAPF